MMSNGVGGLPLSDSNITTTHIDCGGGLVSEQPPAVAAFCNLDESEDINVSQRDLTDI
jgi:hypothetical protein